MRSQETSDFRALCQCQCVLYIHPEISDRTFDLRMSQQDLDRSEISSSFVYDRRLGSPQGMGTVILARQSNSCDPFVNKTGILPYADVGRVVGAAREGEILEGSPS